MRADQHALDEAMRIGLEIVTILERSGLALIAIDRHQPWTGLAQHRAPLSSGGKARTAKAPQGRIVERLEQFFLGQSAGAQPLEQLIAAAGDIGVVVDIVGQMRVGVAAPGRRQYAGNTGVIDKVVTDLDCRRGVAAADAGRAHHANAGAGTALQVLQQLFAAQHRAGQGIADPDGQRRNVRRALLHHVEMGVEGRGFEHLGKRQLHLVGERGQVGGGDLVIAVLDQMQVLDQEVATPRPVAEQCGDLLGGLRDRPGVPWGWPWPVGDPRPDARTHEPAAHHDLSGRLVLVILVQIHLRLYGLACQMPRDIVSQISATKQRAGRDVSRPALW